MSGTRFEDLMNRLTDMDAGWWPFLRLRPARHERMDNARLLRMSLHFGPLYGLLVFCWYLYVGFVQPSPMSAAACVLAAVAFFFVFYKFTFAIFWNRRAVRLQAEGGPHAERFKIPP